jgi:hypothetical protein
MPIHAIVTHRMRKLPRVAASSFAFAGSLRYRRYLCEWTNDVMDGIVSGSTVCEAGTPCDDPDLLRGLARARIDGLARYARNPNRTGPVF